MKRLALVFLALLPCLPARGQLTLNNIPQEKVYLHFDNTSYYQGDHIWFKCYVVTAGQNRPTELSKTLYVELLNPGGEVIDKRTLRITDGGCHGDFMLNRLPFYSGFYEVRAYTKYMLSFGEEAIFSRLLPVFETPETPGDFTGKKMMSPKGRFDYPMKRPRSVKEKAVNVRFFPEGGHLIRGVPSRVAFEATDEFGNPIDITGIPNLSPISHEGRGIFTHIPAGTAKETVEVEHAGKKYRFELPEALPQGVAMEVDNLSYPDSLLFTFRKTPGTPVQTLGVAILSGGQLHNSFAAHIGHDEIAFKIDKTSLPAGVSQIVLFDESGNALSDRLIFTAPGKSDLLQITAKTDKPFYQPYEPVEIEFSVTDPNPDPHPSPFSLSVRDTAHEVGYRRNILTDLLLMSEIRGYVRDPMYYFEGDDQTHRTALDLLLMVQGWRRYSWAHISGAEPFEPQYLPEQGIDVSGRVISMEREKPQPDIEIFMLLYDLKKEVAMHDSSVTDPDGRFSFVTDLSGRWGMTLSTKDAKGKVKGHRILLDRLFTPAPRRYAYTDLQLTVAGEATRQASNEEEAPAELPDNSETLLQSWLDSLSRLGIDRRLNRIEAVTVKGKKQTRESEILDNRSNSVAYYDMATEKDAIYDSGEFVGDDLHQVLKNRNPNFTIRYSGGTEFILYRGKMVLFVIDYQRVDWSKITDIIAYRRLPLDAIRSIYINEDEGAIMRYVYHPYVTSLELAGFFNCVVFIETWPKGEIPLGAVRGVRRTTLEGYNTTASEFYSPDYSILPLEADYRRTLYWNPDVTPDSTGRARVRFHNNGGIHTPGIDAQTVSPEGAPGLYRQ